MDAHGSVDVCSEGGWGNVLVSSGERAEVIGANLNALLKVLFLLFARRTSSLPGRPEPWAEALEPIFICLLQLCQLDDLLVRVDVLLGRMENTLSRSYSDETQSLCIGAVCFLLCLLRRFAGFLLPGDVIKLHLFAEQLASRCSQQQPGYDKLRLLVGQLVSAARAELLGLQVSCGASDLINSASPAMPSALIPNANIPISVGAWDPDSAVSATAKLKAELTSGGGFKLEIFGGGDFLDEVSDEEEEEVKKEEQERVVYVPRVRQGVGLLSCDPHLHHQLLQQTDLLELARQWTLGDQALFRSLSLQQLLQSCASSSSAAQGDALHTGGARRFIERFNLASSWLTACILSRPSAPERAHTITQLIELAQHLVDLSNFHGLMAVLSALQQGSVTRLQISFDLVSADKLTQLAQLKALMAGEKNYAKYRETLAALMTRIAAADSGSGWKAAELGISGAESTGPNSNASSEEAKGADDKPLLGIIPHLGAHLAALTAIAECHGDHLTDHAHLFNLVKWRLCYAAIEPLQRLQQMPNTYPFTPVRMITAALHNAWKANQMDAKQFYVMAERLEPQSAIQQHMAAKQRQLSPPPPTVTIKAAAPTESSSEEEESEEEEDEEEEEEQPVKRKGKLRKLMKILGVISKR